MFVIGLGTTVPVQRYAQRECWDALQRAEPFAHPCRRVFCASGDAAGDRERHSAAAEIVSTGAHVWRALERKGKSNYPAGSRDERRVNAIFTSRSLNVAATTSNNETTR